MLNLASRQKLTKIGRNFVVTIASNQASFDRTDFRFRIAQFSKKSVNQIPIVGSNQSHACDGIHVARPSKFPLDSTWGWHARLVFRFVVQYRE